MTEVALRCLTDLLVTHPHFNYRTNIISVIVPFITHKDPKVFYYLFKCLLTTILDGIVVPIGLAAACNFLRQDERY